ncbi:MAG: hypothetical protein HFJ57_03390 [Clostridia bacterium]|nr:hypothetical protein [Clostridia bacterium]
MDTSNMKNIVVLKNLPSNIVEEAIVILKSNAKVKNINKKKENVKVVAKGKTNSKDYIIKEAESVIASYISSVEKPKQLEQINKNLRKKYERVKKLTAFFAVIAVFAIVVNLI